MTVTLEPLPMQEASAFWKDKIHLSPGEFAKLSDEARIMAFAVSGIAKGAQLTTVFNALQKAIENGTSFSAFKKQCREIFERRGWTGKRSWRVQNIFRTNIQTAYNAGQYKRQKEMAETFPYLQYSAVNDRRTRPTHKALDDKVFPVDHPFWDTWYPPNGYRCRCTTLSLTRRQVERLGVEVESKDPTNTAVMVPDPTTGAMVRVQQLLPDPGFSHHPGKVIWGGMLENAGLQKVNFKQMKKLLQPADYKRPLLKNVRPAALGTINRDDLLRAGKDNSYYRDEFIKRYGKETVLTDPAGEAVILSLRAFLVNKNPGAEELWKFAKRGHAECIPLIKDAIEHPFEIWLTPQQDTKSGRIRLSKRYVALWKTGDKKRIGGLIVFEVVDGVFQGVTAFIPMKKPETADLNYMERQRRGVLLYPRR